MKVTLLLGAWLVLSPSLFAQHGLKTERALKNAVKFLTSQQQKDGSFPGGDQISTTALAGIALLESGLKVDAEEIEKAAQFLRIAAPAITNTNSLALTILFLDRVGQKGDVELIQALAIRLLGGQNVTGGWSLQAPLTKGDYRRVRKVVEDNWEQTTRHNQPSKITSSETRLELAEQYHTQLAEIRKQIPRIPQEANPTDTGVVIYPSMALGVAWQYGVPVSYSLTHVENRAFIFNLMLALDQPQFDWGVVLPDTGMGTVFFNSKGTGFREVGGVRVPFHYKWTGPVDTAPGFFKKAPGDSKTAAGGGGVSAGGGGKRYYAPGWFRMAPGFVKVNGGITPVKAGAYVTKIDGIKGKGSLADLYRKPQDTFLDMMYSADPAGYNFAGVGDFNPGFEPPEPLGPRMVYSYKPKQLHVTPLMLTEMMLAQAINQAMNHDWPAGAALFDQLKLNGKELNRLRDENAAIGFQVMANFFEHRFPADPPLFLRRLGPQDAYFLFSIQQVAAIHERKRILGKDFYSFGRDYFLATQLENGAWHGGFYPPTVDTSFALLFIHRADVMPRVTDRLRELVGRER